MTHTSANIKRIAAERGLQVKTVIPNQFAEIEYLAVSIERFKTAFFLMDNETFDFGYSHTYDAKTDKTTKRTPKGF